MELIKEIKPEPDKTGKEGGVHSFLPLSYLFIEETKSIVIFYIIPFPLLKLRLKNEMRLSQKDNDFFLTFEDESENFILLFPVEILKRIFEKAKNKDGKFAFWIITGKPPSQINPTQISSAIFDTISVNSVEIAKLIGYMEALKTKNKN